MHVGQGFTEGPLQPLVALSDLKAGWAPSPPPQDPDAAPPGRRPLAPAPAGAVCRRPLPAVFATQPPEPHHRVHLIDHRLGRPGCHEGTASAARRRPIASRPWVTKSSALMAWNTAAVMAASPVQPV